MLHETRDGQLNDDKKNVSLSMNLISINVSLAISAEIHRPVHYDERLQLA